MALIGIAQTHKPNPMHRSIQIIQSQTTNTTFPRYLYLSLQPHPRLIPNPPPIDFPRPNQALILLLILSTMQTHTTHLAILRPSPPQRARPPKSTLSAFQTLFVTLAIIIGGVLAADAVFDTRIVPGGNGIFWGWIGEGGRGDGSCGDGGGAVAGWCGQGRDFGAGGDFDEFGVTVPFTTASVPSPSVHSSTTVLPLFRL